MKEIKEKKAVQMQNLFALNTTFTPKTLHYFCTALHYFCTVNRMAVQK